MNLESINLSLFNLIVYLGCGEQSELSIPNTTQLLLVDANEELTKHFAVVSGAENIQVKHAYLSNKQASQEFKKYTLEKFNGIGDTKVLNSLYPGLKQLEQDMVHTIDVAQWMKKEVGDLAEKSCLILDIPSQNSSLLKSLLEANQLHCFQTVLVKQGIESLFDDALSAKTLQQWLESNGYLIRLDISEDPDFAMLTANINPLYLENKKLHTKLTEKTASLREKAVVLNSIQVLQKELEGQLAEKAVELSATQARLEDSGRELLQEKELSKAKSQQIEALRSQVQEKENDLKVAKEQAVTFENQRNNLVKERDDQAEKTEVLDVKYKELTQDFENLQIELSTMILKNKKLEAELLKTNIQFELIQETFFE